ncbi:MAG TPA: enoyl-CoA hydratase/isomerase family protein [Nitrolancea sp.]
MTNDSAESPLLVQKENDVVTLTLNRPRYRNAVNFELLTLLDATLDRLTAEPPRIIVLRGSAPGFCSGIDLKESRETNQEFARRRVSLMHRVLKKLRLVPAPLIVSCDGVTAGLGTELLISGDLRFATNSSRMSYPEPRVAVPSPAHRLVWLIGLTKAQDMLLTARWVDAEEGEQIGLITRAVDDLDATVNETIEQLRGLSPLALAQTKENLWVSVQAGSEGASAHHIAAVTLSATTADRREALSAFAEKRTPKYPA